MRKEAIDYTKIADIYDEFVRESFDIPFFLEECMSTDGPVLELMSGTGRVSIPLLEKGIPLTCVDNSPEMLSVLRDKLNERNLSASVHRMDVCELDLDETFDLIILPFQSFSEILSVGNQKRALEAIRRHLSNVGRFICTLHNPTVRLQHADGQLRLWKTYPRKAKEGTVLLCGAETVDPETLHVRLSEFIEFYDAGGRLEEKRTVDVRFVLHQKDTFEKLIHEAGFQTGTLYGNYDRSPFHEESSLYMIWSLRPSGRTLD